MIAIACGIVVALVTGFFENMPEVSIGAKYYGFPLYWRVSMILISPKDKFIFTRLTIDIIFWIIVSLAAILILRKLLQKASSSAKTPQTATSKL
jgi:membrane protein implicated in regulation of membrane protease activity